MGRPMQRQTQGRRRNAPNKEADDMFAPMGGAGGPPPRNGGGYYSRRGGRYEVGQAHRYMHDFHDGHDEDHHRYFARQFE